MPTDHLDALASAILQEDLTDIYEQLSHVLTAYDHRELGIKLELCPTHYCDDQICRDDQAHCYEDLPS